MRWQTDFNENLATLIQSQMSLDRDLKDAEDNIRKLSDQHSRNYTLQGKLQAEVEVYSANMAQLH